MRVIRGFTKEIYLAVKVGKLKQPFTAAMAKKACPGWADRTYTNFFRKHSEGNKNGETEWFVIVSRGLYRLKYDPKDWV
jgi:hypothetical protein